MSRSGVIVPIFAGDRLLGMLDVENHETENAYGDADVRLLSTVAASMGVALENARLFDETQRLLKETERRSSELAVINSIQQGMAAELNFQSIVDLVGDKLRELFNTGDMSIRWRDENDQPRPSALRLRAWQAPFAAADEVQPRSEARPGIAEGRAGRPEKPGRGRCDGHQDHARNRYEPVQRLPADLRRRSVARLAHARELRTRGCLRRCGSEAPQHRGGVDGRRARERAPARGDAAPRARSLRRWPRWGATCRRRSISRPSWTASPATRRTCCRPATARSSCRIRGPRPTARSSRSATSPMPSRPWSIEGGKGIIGSIVQSGQPELVNDAEADPRGVQIPGTARQQDERLMVVPLVADGAVEGAMAVWRTGGQLFDDRDLQFLVGLARQAMVALRNARLFNGTKEALERQTATADILKVISSSHDGSPAGVRRDRSQCSRSSAAASSPTCCCSTANCCISRRRSDTRARIPED